jgi:CSLREA domain-containing protein
MSRHLAPNKKARRRRYQFAALVVLTLLALCATGLRQPAARAAAAFAVNSTGDGADSNTGDNVCDDGAGNCTLRAAIQQANATPGADVINFNVTGTITLAAALPNLSSDITISGPGASLLTVRRNASDFYSFTVAAGATAGISGLTISGGGGGIVSPFQGGGVMNNSGTLNLTNCALSGNVGVGVANINGGKLNVTNCAVNGNAGLGIYNSSSTANVVSSTVSGNSSNGGFGAGIDNFSGLLKITGSTISGNTNNGGAAGGIMNNIGSTAVIENSTVSGNTAGAGAGLYNNGTLTLTNVTVSGNTANVFRNDGGGGIDNGGTLSLTNCTVVGNTAAGGGGGIFGGSVTNFRNTIVAGNTSTAGIGHDLHGTFNSQDYNLIGNAASATINGTTTHNITGQDAKLGPLADNGGPTRTHALLAGSPALDAGSNALAGDANGNNLLTDQRGAGRVGGAALVVDIGAYEFHAALEDFTARATNEDTPLLFSFSVGDGGPGVASVTATSDNQALIPDANISANGGSVWTLRAAPTANQFGTANIALTVNYANGVTVNDSFQLTVRSANDAPSFTRGADQTVAEDAGSQTIDGWATGINSGPPDESSQAVTFQVTGNTNAALFSAPPAVSPSGALTFTTAPDANGSATLTLVAKDDGGTANGGQDTSAAQTFKITVTPVNDAPVAQEQSINTPEDTARLVFPRATDADNDEMTLVIVSGPAHGTLTGAGGTRTYTPAPNYNGPDGFTFKVTDTSGAESQTATVSITVTAVNDPPVNTVPNGQVIDKGTTLVFSAANSNAISIADVDAGTDPLRVTLTTANGTLTLGGTAGLTFTAGDGTNDATMTFAGTRTDLNAALNGLSFKHAPDFSGFTTIQMTTNDQGSTGSGGARSDNDAVGITVKTSAVEFKQAAYAASEGGGAVVVAVTRTGDTSQPASVGYATDDGSFPNVSVPCSATTGAALDRCDYTKGLGRLVFAPGETEKTFSVLVGDDSYVEGTETALVRLSGVSGTGAVLGPRAAATLEITDDAQESSANPIDESGRFVRQHYHDFLNREPDAEGLAFWTAEIGQCGADAQCREVKRINVSAAFFVSIEFQETGYFVYRAYKAAYGEAGSVNMSGTVPVVRLNEFLPDTQRIGQSVVVGAPGWPAQLEANKQAYALEFVQRARFTSAFPLAMTADRFVDKLLLNAGITLTTTERDQLVSTLGATPADASKRAQVLRAVTENPQLRQAEFNRAFVLMEYFGYLRRNPDDAPEATFNYAGWKFWLDKLNEFGGNYVQAEMVKAFLTSDEYRKRFGQ